MLACYAQVLIEFPCELVSAVVAGRWAASSSALKPWLFGYQARLVMAAVVTAIVRPSSTSLRCHPPACKSVWCSGTRAFFAQHPVLTNVLGAMMQATLLSCKGCIHFINCKISLISRRWL